MRNSNQTQMGGWKHYSEVHSGYRNVLNSRHRDPPLNSYVSQISGFVTAARSKSKSDTPQVSRMKRLRFTADTTDGISLRS